MLKIKGGLESFHTVFERLPKKITGPNLAMNIHNELLNKVSQWVLEYFQNNYCADCIFHDYNHTKETVEAGKEIATAMQVSADELETVLISCWFHDLGLFHSRENHEIKSAEMAEEFLKKHAVNKEKIKAVKACILATKNPQKPVTLLEKIICDADMSHLEKGNYFKKNALLRQEFELSRRKSYSEVEWWTLNKDFFQEHNYFTTYALKQYNVQKM